MMVNGIAEALIAVDVGQAIRCEPTPSSIGIASKPTLDRRPRIAARGTSALRRAVFCEASVSRAMPMLIALSAIAPSQICAKDLIEEGDHACCSSCSFPDCG